MLRWRNVALSFLAAGSISNHSWAADSTVSGQVYIVTNGQQVIKLPLTQVFAISEANLKAYLSAKAQVLNERRLAQVGTLRNQLREISEAEAANAREFAEYREAGKKWLDAYSDCNLMSGRQAEDCRKSPELAELAERNRNLKTAVQPELNRIEEMRQNSMKTLKALQEGTDAASFFAELPSAPLQHLAAATTDVDGKFSLRIPAGKRVAIVASNRRDVVGKQERYLWVLWYDLRLGQRQVLELANNNLIDTGCALCVQHTNYIKALNDASAVK